MSQAEKVLALRPKPSQSAIPFRDRIAQLMLAPLRKMVRAGLLKRGYVPLEVRPEFPPDFDECTIDVLRQVRKFTMTSPERVFALCKSIEHIVQHDVPGDIVECGVWKGGSMMAAARTLMNHNVVRTLHLFDTFEGMTAPSDFDRDFSGKRATDLLALGDRNTSHFWAYSPFDEVVQNLNSTGYDQERIVYVKGRVEDTIPARAPERIALLRLDTDWYESTYHELTHLYPRLSVGGILIIDDYGYWQGARKAVDQYIREKRLKLLLNRIDDTARMCVKTEA